MACVVAPARARRPNVFEAEREASPPGLAPIRGVVQKDDAEVVAGAGAVDSNRACHKGKLRFGHPAGAASSRCIELRDQTPERIGPPQIGERFRGTHMVLTVRLHERRHSEALALGADLFLTLLR